MKKEIKKEERKKEERKNRNIFGKKVKTNYKE